jgi:hypothetical protein
LQALPILALPYSAMPRSCKGLYYPWGFWGLASGMNNAASRIAQLTGVALAAGIAGYAGGYLMAMGIAAGLSFAGAMVNASISMESQPAQE